MSSNASFATADGDATPMDEGRTSRRSMSPVDLLTETIEEQKAQLEHAGKGFQHHETMISELSKGQRALQTQMQAVLIGLQSLQRPSQQAEEGPYEQLTRSGHPSIALAKRAGVATRGKTYKPACPECGKPQGTPMCCKEQVPKNEEGPSSSSAALAAQRAAKTGTATATPQATAPQPEEQKRRVKFDATAAEASSGDETDATDPSEGSDDEEDVAKERRKDADRYLPPSVIMSQAHLEDPTMWEQYDLAEVDRAMTRYWRQHVNDDNFSGRTAMELMEVMLLWSDDPSDPQVVLRLIDMVSQTVLFNRHGPQAAEAFQEELQKGRHSVRLREAFRKAAKKKQDKKTTTHSSGASGGGRFNRDRDNSRGGGGDRRSGGLFLGRDEYAKLSEEQRKQLAALRSAVKR